MNAENKIKKIGIGLWVELSFATLLLVVLTFAAFGQTDAASGGESMAVKTPETERQAVKQPVFTNYKAVKIGTSAKEVREALGKPKIADDEGFYFVLSDDEQVQIRLDAEKNVRFISITYADKKGAAPKYADVFGADADATPFTKPDGSIYNLIRYPEAGVWIAYSRTAGDEATVSVTMQKL